MSDKRDEDGFLYSGYRVVKKGGKIKIDNEYYQNDKLLIMTGEKLFISNVGEYWKTVYAVYMPGFNFKRDYIICTLT